jgi:hypothetical protein
MKKGFIVFVALLSTAFAGSVFAQATSTLCAGQTQNAGTVVITHDATNIYVTYNAAAGFLIYETHAHVTKTLGDIPVTSKGNPVPGNFAQKTTHNPGVTTFQYTFTRNGSGTYYVAAHAVVSAATVTPAPYFPSVVVSSQQGTTNGGAIPVENSDPNTVLVIPGVFSLGFGGHVTVEFDCPVTNGTGNDFSVWEETREDINLYNPIVPFDAGNPATYAYPQERANVEISNDGVNWTSLGLATNGRSSPANRPGQQHPNNFDLGAFTDARFVRVTDTTDQTLHTPADGTDDGFDVLVIKADQACTEQGDDETAWGGACAPLPLGTKFVSKGNWGTYLTYIIP